MTRRSGTPSRARATGGGGGGGEGPCWGRGQMFGKPGNPTANRPRAGPLREPANVTVQGKGPPLGKRLHRD